MTSITRAVEQWAKAHAIGMDSDVSGNGARATSRFSTEISDLVEADSYVEAYEDRNTVMVFMYVPFQAPPQLSESIYEIMAAINYDLISGTLGMDVDRGSLRYRGSAVVVGSFLSSAMIDDLLDTGKVALARFIETATRILHHDMSPETALAMGEEASSSECISYGSVDSDVCPTPLPWKFFNDDQSLRDWAADIQQAIAAGSDLAAWVQAGRAVMLVNDDPEYCLHAFVRVAAECNMQFLHISAGDVLRFQPPKSHSNRPRMIYLESEGWLSDDQSKGSDSAQAFKNRLAEWMSDFSPSHPVVYVSSVSRLKNAAEELCMAGRFERFISLAAQTQESRGEAFLNRVGLDICSEAMKREVHKVGLFLQKEVSDARRRDLLAMYLQRLSRREQRLVHFIDLAVIIGRDLTENAGDRPDINEWRHLVSVHEAGHAVVALVDSEGKNIPEYASILPSAEFKGVIVESLSFHSVRDELNTYRDFRHNVRICLAGRAAEELMFGIEGITSGSSADLEQASRQAYRAFGFWGFIPEMETQTRTSTNLWVTWGTPSPSELQHIETLGRKFLADEYEFVKSLLVQNREMLKHVADRLSKTPILSQSELLHIYKQFINASVT